MKNSHTLILTVGLLALTAPSAFAAPTDKLEKPWLVRFRLLNLDPANESNAFTALGINFPKDAVHVSSKLFPEVDFSYFFNEKFAAELILTYPQRHDVTLKGVGKLGTVDHLPPTLTFQYHHQIGTTPYKPYVGLGFNYTRITHADLSVAGTALDVSRDSFGLAYQIGLDYKLKENLFLNFDFKHLNLDTDVKVKSSGAKLTNAKLNPNLLSVGVGFRF